MQKDYIIDSSKKGYLIFQKKDNFTVFNCETYKIMQADNVDVDELEDVNIDITMKKKTDYDVESLVINMAETCNLCCRYCFATAGTYGNTAREKLIDEKCIKEIEKFIILKKSIRSLHFFGGEPLLNFEGIRNMVEWIEKESLKCIIPPIRFSITTNGTLITDEVADFFKKHSFDICVSLDGPQETTNEQRKSMVIDDVYGTIIKGIKKLEKRKIPYAIEATVSLDKMCLMEKEEKETYIKSFFELEACDIGFFLDMTENILLTERVKKTIDELCEIETRIYFENSVHGYSEKSISDINSIITSLMSKKKREMCMAGKKQFLISANGDVYPCQTFYAKRMAELGKITEYKKKYTENTQKEFELPIKCKSCNYVSLCGNKCPGGNLLSCNDEKTVSEVSCYYHKTLVNEVMCQLFEIRKDAEQFSSLVSNIKIRNMRGIEKC